MFSSCTEQPDNTLLTVKACQFEFHRVLTGVQITQCWNEQEHREVDPHSVLIKLEFDLPTFPNFRRRRSVTIKVPCFPQKFCRICDVPMNLMLASIMGSPLYATIYLWSCKTLHAAFYNNGSSFLVVKIWERRNIRTDGVLAQSYEGCG